MASSLRWRGLALLCTLALLAAAGLRLMRPTRGGGGPPAQPAEAGRSEENALVAAREPLVEPRSPRPGSARAFLEGYHGARWPAVEAAMERAGLDLDQPFTAQPWEEVEPAMREQARLDDSMRKRLENKDWVAPLTNAWLQKEYALPAEVVLDGAELAELEAELADVMLELERCDRSYADQLDFHLRSAFERGEFARAPFSTCGVDSEQGFFSKAIVSGTWAATLVLRDEECPDLVELRATIREFERERDRRVQAFLERRSGR